MIGFLSFLLILQVMMIIWSVSIARVAIRVLKGNSAEDIRSDDEEEEEADGEELEREIQPLEEEVGVEAIDLKGWARRTGIGGVSTSSSVMEEEGHRLTACVEDARVDADIDADVQSVQAID
ncbi:uncharacterized protein GIQ15_01315 [Arthroderma uncinatum]|uniref:uncharacterized protein n=1 Tax=Arthroderma uncinatum TaxID=74035 RepID=UPI00144AB6EC|nr:uncharacterized protein GIQ15_01315 [Arthroderma uncinatum]KAF3491798.1 hypothetical protein GIQ15_01315 [Arthroderma uncinatum]